ncbi:hypothetical protein [Albidovulum sp.]|uniref:hypothetical protein n=1 Tax=Albidovulum sp. TaxID=1872424 RepID=UPI0039B8433B
MTHRRFLTIAAVVVASLLALREARAEQYWVDGYCVEFDGGHLNVTGIESLSPSIQPTFHIPYLSSSEGVSKIAKDISVQFSFSDSGRKERISRSESSRYRFSKRFSACFEEVTSFGLRAWRHAPDPKCTIIEGDTVYDAENKATKYGAIFVRCGGNPAVKTCLMRDVYENGGWSEIFIPKELIKEWREVGDVVEDYFMSNIKLCGEQ